MLMAASRTRAEIIRHHLLRAGRPSVRNQGPQSHQQVVRRVVVTAVSLVGLSVAHGSKDGDGATVNVWVEDAADEVAH
jgi:hypothetical protein